MPRQALQPAADDSPRNQTSTSEANPAERRREARYPTNDEAEIEILTGAGRTVYGTVVDVSRSGIRVALPVELGKGMELRVTTERTTILGEVRYCRRAARGFEAGVLIRQVEQLTKQEIQHLADDHLELYAIGKGLSVGEVIELRGHLLQCEQCRVRLADTQAILDAPKRKKR